VGGEANYEYMVRMVYMEVEGMNGIDIDYIHIALQTTFFLVMQWAPMRAVTHSGDERIGVIARRSAARKGIFPAGRQRRGRRAPCPPVPRVLYAINQAAAKKGRQLRWPGDREKARQRRSGNEFCSVHRQNAASMAQGGPIRCYAAVYVPRQVDRENVVKTDRNAGGERCMVERR